MHVAADVAPTAELYVPGAQDVHEAADGSPVALLYVPARQGEHVALVVAPETLDQVPATHAVHSGAPKALYVPRAHNADTAEPPVQNEPAGHGLPAGMALPDAQAKPAEAEHATHVSIDVANVTLLKVPARHALHGVDLPSEPLHVPAGQGFSALPYSQYDPN